jgi:hypothetical protein
MPPDHPTEPESDVFAGSKHVLYGIQTQIDFWNALSGHSGEKQEMLPALTTAAETLRNALQRARGGTSL